MQRGSNQNSAGGYNRTLVLDLVRRAVEGVSRVELAAETGLSAQTISNVTRRLVEDGLIRETGKQSTGPGKPRVTLRLVADARFAVGIHLDPSFITYVILDLGGTVIARSRTGTPAGARPAETIERLAAAVDELIVSSGLDRQRILGVGIAAPGPINAQLGILLDPPLLSAWHNVPLRESLSRAMGLAVLLEKDATSAAVAERWMAREHERDDFLFFYYGTGVGSGLVLDGDVMRGSSSNAGDIAHIRVEENGVQCRCGSRGCLGDATAPAYLVAEAVAVGLIPAEPSAEEPVHAAFTRLTDLARSGDRDAAAILQPVARRFARALVTLLNILDVNRVTFGGPFWERLPATFLDSVAALTREDPALIGVHPVDFAGSALGDDVAAIGAACLVLDNTFSPRPATLLIDGRSSAS
jgi:predicted NBD/HSP70 family sugar kinase